MKIEECESERQEQLVCGYSCEEFFGFVNAGGDDGGEGCGRDVADHGLPVLVDHRVDCVRWKMKTKAR
ncbi:jg2017 [Pararge aegeria aegeria]|uniref:Jg2017 protein n=1 Tax=Pararge aegeria aegeria TaxID=348720 RepID=A0A8S4SAV3_9NEOP|nr:jg2017 [Pararge aegeria aegeria]